jgi:pilus assembly protein FimV
MVLSPKRILRVARVNIPVSLLRLVAAAALALPVLAHAAGLGRLTVQSSLGQPLRAEIEIVSIQAGEESSLEARLASGNAFAQAGIEFNAVLNTVKFALDKRDGRPMVVVTTRQPVNEPFLDLLVELRWATGLFVREYTILLDPPGYEGPKPQPAAAAPAVPAAPGAGVPGAMATAPAPAAAERAPAEPRPSEITPAPRPEERPMESAAARAEDKPAASAEAKPAAPAAPTAAAPAEQPSAAPQAAQTYEVKKGDTLGEIALRYRPAGVTFHQMLIALQRANEEAFIRSNINLVRAGRILNIPDAETAAAVEPADASRLVIAQHSEFAEYRSRLAAAVATAPAAATPAEQRAEGPITAQPEAPKPAAPADQLKLSRADTKKPGAAPSKSARQDDLAAKERALQEAQSRVSDLEKNVTDLQKLLEIQNQQLAQLQQKAAKPAPAAPGPAAKAPEAPKPVPAPQAAKAPEPKPAAAAPPKPAAEPAKPAGTEPKPAAAPVPVEPKPAPAPVVVAAAPKPAAQAPKPPATAAKPKPKPVAPPPPEPGFFDDFLADPTTTLGGLGLIVLLLGGYGAWAWQRKKKSVAKFKDSVLGSASLAPAMAEAAPVAAAGAQAAPQPSVSPSTAGAVDADDVDPIAEADVYMAYGRDTQAEEILKEALQKDPNRVAVHAKLLEIYANRRDAQAFEQTALKLKGATGGVGPEWDKAMALGRSIDPSNGLYGGAGETTPVPVPAFAAAAATAAAPSVDFDIGGGGAAETPVTAAPSLDLDISGPASAPPAEKTDFSPGGTLIIDSEDSKAATGGLDFDLGGAGEKPADVGGGLNFDLPASAPSPSAPEPAPSAAGSASGGLEFDLNLGGGGEPRDASPPALDLSEISLDLGGPGEASPAGGGNGNGASAKWQEVATKLDLAKAYEEMGDKDGARELLNEVLREGDSAQQGQANQILAKLA